MRSFLEWLKPWRKRDCMLCCLFVKGHFFSNAKQTNAFYFQLSMLPSPKGKPSEEKNLRTVGFFSNGLDPPPLVFLERFKELFKASALWADSFYKSKCPSVRLYVCLCVCLCVCLFTFEVPFNGLFAPTSRSRMSAKI